jgi:hypothetical protein
MASKDLKGDGLGLPLCSIPVFRYKGKKSLQNNISNRYLIRKPKEHNLRALLSISIRPAEDYKVNCKS